MATVKIVSLISRAATLVQDTTGTRWPKAELLNWYNDAVLAVVGLRPDAHVRNESFPCEAGTKQTIPVTGLKLINVRRNLGGNKSVIRKIPEQQLNDQVPDWHDPANSGTFAMHYVYDDRDPKTFYLYPGVPAAHPIEIVYSVAPAAAVIANFDTDTQVIALDDIYANPILDFMLYRAYSKDANYTANAGRAQMHYQAFAEALGAKTQADMGVSPNTPQPENPVPRST